MVDGVGGWLRGCCLVCLYVWALFRAFMHSCFCWYCFMAMYVVVMVIIARSIVSMFMCVFRFVFSVLSWSYLSLNVL